LAVADRAGYIYRRAGVSADELRDLLGPESVGWAWTPAFMYTRGAHRDDDLLRGAEGCAHHAGIELRWRRTNALPKPPMYDVLALALTELSEETLPGFAPLPPDGTPWQTEPTRMRLQHPLGDPPKEGDDEPRAATNFLAPDGSVQFVALIE
jgi:hypothetical protein